MSMVVLPDGRFAKIVKTGALCVCCKGENQEVVLNLVLLRHFGQPLPGGEVPTWEAVYEYVKRAGIDVSLRAVRDHTKAHVEFSDAPQYATGAGSGDHVMSPAEQEERQIAAFRKKVGDRIGDDADSADARGRHITYLERVVEVAIARVEEFPEQVTLEMGLRAAGELVKSKSNSERDELLRMLAQASQRKPASIQHNGVQKVRRGVLDAVPEEVRVVEDDPTPRALPTPLVAD